MDIPTRMDRLTRYALVIIFLAAASPASLSDTTSASSARQRSVAETGDYVMFAINVQDFSYPELSVATVRRILDIHETYQVPVDIYLTNTMADLYAADAPDLLERLRTSSVASVSYHVRPPSPYYTDYDWAGLGTLSRAEQEAAILAYESHGLDLVTGEPTAGPGGYAKLAETMGYAPVVVGAQTNGGLGPAVNTVFRELGAELLVEHGRAINLGEMRDGIALRPEHYDLLLFQHIGEKPKTLLKDALAEAKATPGAVAPFFVGVKMHDNDFFAVESAWVTNYARGPKRPPFDPTRLSDLLSDAEQQAVWKQYEKTVKYVGRKRATYQPVNAPLVVDMIDDGGGNQAASLYLSGTMHIESNPASWPDADALVAFLERATRSGHVGDQASGMRWSIGADLGWLRGEPRAGEIIRRTEALGVEWDIHAHELSDRADVYAEIQGLGGHPNDVASGLVYTEIDPMRDPLTNGTGDSWQARVLWGVVWQPRHGPDSDDFAVGVWRPKSAAEWTTHDANGSLIAVGGGSRELSAIGRFAETVAADAGALPPVISATVMVSPRRLVIPDTSDGIEAIEEWANRVGALRGLRWATIRETADAWVAAGSVPSRMDDWD